MVHYWTILAEFIDQIQECAISKILFVSQCGGGKNPPAPVVRYPREKEGKIAVNFFFKLIPL